MRTLCPPTKKIKIKTYDFQSWQRVWGEMKKKKVQCHDNNRSDDFRWHCSRSGKHVMGPICIANRKIDRILFKLSHFTFSAFTHIVAHAKCCHIFYFVWRNVSTAFFLLLLFVCANEVNAPDEREIMKHSTFEINNICILFVSAQFHVYRATRALTHEPNSNANNYTERVSTAH